MKRPNIDAQKKRLRDSGLLDGKVYYWGQWNSKYEKRTGRTPVQSKDLFSVCLREEGQDREYDAQLAEEVGKELARFIVHAGKDLHACHVYIGQLEARHRALVNVHEALMKENIALKEAGR